MRITNNIEMDGSVITLNQGAFSTALTAGAAGSDITVTLPAVTSTVSTLAGTETLTNKTLTSPKLNENVAVTTTATKLNYITNATGTTGTDTTNIVFSTSPTLVTPTLGVASVTSVNKVAVTAPATSATLTLADGSTLVTSGANSITLTSTGATNVTLPTSGTLYGTATGSITSAQLLASLSDETGTGIAVFNTSPTLVTPILGAATATSINGATITSTTGGTLTLANSSSLVTSGANSITLTSTGATNVTLPTTGTLATTSNKLSAFAATTSAELAGVISDETGSGVLVFGTSPTLTTPVIATGAVVQAAGYIRFNETDNTNYIGLKAPGTVAANVTFTLPDADGTADYVLKTDGSGNLGWVAPLTNPMDSEGDLIYGGIGGAATKLDAGTAEYMLQANGAAAPTWALVNNANIDAAAAIAVSKLAAVTASKALVSDVSGFVSAASTTATQIGYLSAATGTTGTTSTNLVYSDSPTLVTPALGTPSAVNLANGTNLPVAGINGLGANVGTFLGTPSSANLAAAVSDETGTGALVFANTPTLVTPVLGAATATTINGATITSTTSGTLTLANSSSLITSGANSITLTSTGATNVTLPTTGTLYGTATGSITSAQLLASLTDETGTGAVVFANTPTLVTPVIGAATGTSLSVTTSVAAAATAGTVTLTSGTATPIVIDRQQAAVAGPAIEFDRRGAFAGASTDAVITNGVLGQFTFKGWDGSAYSEGALIKAVSTGTYSGTSSPAKLTFFTTPSASQTAIENMSISSAGLITLGASGGTQVHAVNGDLAVTGSISGTFTGTVSGTVTSANTITITPAISGAGNYNPITTNTASALTTDNQDVFMSVKDNGTVRSCIGMRYETTPGGAVGYLFTKTVNDAGIYWYATSGSTNVYVTTSSANLGTTSGTLIGGQTSDERIKSNITSYTDGLDKILQLQPIKYTLYNQQEIGFGAQTTENIIPESVRVTGEKLNPSDENSPSDLRQMEYVRIIPALVNAIKELNARIAVLEGAN